jgi:fascin 1/2
MSSPLALEWKMGFKNHSTQLYLTQESFGFNLNCNGKSLKKKQTFTLVSKDGAVHIKTHLDKYMYGDKDGNVKGDADAPSADTQWTIVPQANGTWALKSAHGFFFHGKGDKLTAFVGGDDVPADGAWVVHLAMHPQINLYNVMRKRFVHMSGGELQCNEDVPWGEDALLSLIFFDEHPEGRYGIMSFAGDYLENSGKMVRDPSPKCQFLLGFHDDQISLCDSEGKFLSSVGAKGTLKVNKTKVTKDELFVMQDSEPQFIIRDVTRNMMVSTRNGAECKADQKVTDITDSERFQLEVDANGKTHLMTNNLTYLMARDDGIIGADAKAQSANTQFNIVWNGPTVQFQHAASGKIVMAKPNGTLVASGDGSEDTSRFEFTIINRPTILLRGQYGFTGLKGASGRVECNRARGTVFHLENKNGAYHLKTEDGGYWGVDQDGVHATSGAPTDFYFEFAQRSKVLIKHADSGKYIKGEQNGGFKATGDSEEINTLWEF